MSTAQLLSSRWLYLTEDRIGISGYELLLGQRLVTALTTAITAGDGDALIAAGQALASEPHAVSLALAWAAEGYTPVTQIWGAAYQAALVTIGQLWQAQQQVAA